MHSDATYALKRQKNHPHHTFVPAGIRISHLTLVVQPYYWPFLTLVSVVMSQGELDFNVTRLGVSATRVAHILPSPYEIQYTEKHCSYFENELLCTINSPFKTLYLNEIWKRGALLLIQQQQQLSKNLTELPYNIS